MNLRPSRIRRILREGGSAAVLKLNLSDPRAVELAGLAAPDALWLCMEHVPNDWHSLESQIRAARIYDVDTLVRVSKGGYSDYLRPLEADATGIIVPHVESAEEARRIVSWVRCPPLGRRALDGGNVDGRFCQVPLREYMEHANREKLLILQIESPEGLAEADAIAGVPGFDILMFGPGDYSARVGRPGEVGAPEVVAARREVAAAARRHGRPLMASGPIAPLPELLAEGHRLFSVGADVIGLGDFFHDRVSRFRAETAPRRSPSP